MNIPVQILDAIQARLEKLTVANGYPITPRAIHRAKLDNFTNQDLPAINYSAPVDSNINQIFGEENRSITILVQCLINTKDAVFLDESYIIGGAIATVLMRNPAFPRPENPVNFDLSGLVDNVTVSSITPFIGDAQSSWAGVAVSFEIAYSLPVGLYF